MDFKSIYNSRLDVGMTRPLEMIPINLIIVRDFLDFREIYEFFLNFFGILKTIGVDRNFIHFVMCQVLISGSLGRILSFEGVAAHYRIRFDNRFNKEIPVSVHGNDIWQIRK